MSTRRSGGRQVPPPGPLPADLPGHSVCMVSSFDACPALPCTVSVRSLSLPVPFGGS